MLGSITYSVETFISVCDEDVVIRARGFVWFVFYQAVALFANMHSAIVRGRPTIGL